MINLIVNLVLENDAVLHGTESGNIHFSMVKTVVQDTESFISNISTKNDKDATGSLKMRLVPKKKVKRCEVVLGPQHARGPQNSRRVGRVFGQRDGHGKPRPSMR